MAFRKVLEQLKALSKDDIQNNSDATLQFAMAARRLAKQPPVAAAAADDYMNHYLISLRRIDDDFWGNFNFENESAKISKILSRLSSDGASDAPYFITQWIAMLDQHKKERSLRKKNPAQYIEKELRDAVTKLHDLKFQGLADFSVPCWGIVTALNEVVLAAKQSHFLTAGGSGDFSRVTMDQISDFLNERLHAVCDDMTDAELIEVCKNLEVLLDRYQAIIRDPNDLRYADPDATDPRSQDRVTVQYINQIKDAVEKLLLYRDAKLRAAHEAVEAYKNSDDCREYKALQARRGEVLREKLRLLKLGQDVGEQDSAIAVLDGKLSNIEGPQHGADRVQQALYDVSQPLYDAVDAYSAAFRQFKSQAQAQSPKRKPFLARHWKKIVFGTIGVAALIVGGVLTGGAIPAIAGLIGGGMAAAGFSAGAIAASSTGLAIGATAGVGLLGGFAASTAVSGVAQQCKPNFFRRHWKAMVLGGLVVGGLAVAGVLTGGLVPAIAGIVGGVVGTTIAVTPVTTAAIVGGTALAGIAVGGAFTSPGCATADIVSQAIERGREKKNAPHQHQAAIDAVGEPEPPRASGTDQAVRARLAAERQHAAGTTSTSTSTRGSPASTMEDDSTKDRSSSSSLSRSSSTLHGDGGGGDEDDNGHEPGDDPRPHR